MQRYFSVSNNEIEIDQSDIHHITHVMRQRVGESFEIVFNGKINLCVIKSTNPFEYEIIDTYSSDRELKNDITLFYALSKGDKNDFVIQKATELGAKKIVLISSSRCVSKMSNEDFARKKVRFKKIIKEAAEQSKRVVVPEILGVFNIKNIPDELICDHNYVAYECESGETNDTLMEFYSIKVGDSVSILIGSEGGISEEEISLLNKKGFKNISLGKRILRTETAAVYALSVLGFVLEAKK